MFCPKFGFFRYFWPVNLKSSWRKMLSVITQYMSVLLNFDKPLWMRRHYSLDAYLLGTGVYKFIHERINLILIWTFHDIIGISIVKWLTFNTLNEEYDQIWVQPVNIEIELLREMLPLGFYHLADCLIQLIA